MNPTRSRLEEEILEQGKILAKRTGPGWESAAAAASALRRDDVDYLMVAARGTSDNAARYAQYLLGTEARLTVGLAAPWLYANEAPPLLSRGALLAISQSGRSPDIVRVVEAARAQRRPTIVITNDPGSPLAAVAEIVVPLDAGEERAVAATKTYLSSLHALAQIAACLRPASRREAWFEALPQLVSAGAEEQLAQRTQFDRLNVASSLTAVGRGLQLPTAYETALKVRELGGIPGEGFSLPDLIHGPIAALPSSGAMWLLSTHGHDQPDVSALELLRGTAAVTVAVSDDDRLLSAVDIPVRIQAGLPEWLAPILAVIPGQAAALRLGELHGADLDRPHGLSKVTLTT